MLREYDYRNYTPAQAFADVMAGNIGVIHNVFEREHGEQAIADAIAFSERVPAFDTKGGTASPEPWENSHRLDNNPKLSTTKHIFHTFNLEDLHALNSNPITFIFARLRQIDNVLCGVRGSHDSRNKVEGPRFHPQIIHYPRGGGYFDPHTHSLEPQKIGLIASLSKRGEDYRTGGTRFWVDGKEVDAEPAQNVGSVTLFRYDLPHSVSEVDADRPLEFGEKTGRWVAVFPYR